MPRAVAETPESSSRRTMSTRDHAMASRRATAGSDRVGLPALMRSSTLLSRPSRLATASRMASASSSRSSSASDSEEDSYVCMRTVMIGSITVSLFVASHGVGDVRRGCRLSTRPVLGSVLQEAGCRSGCPPRALTDSLTETVHENQDFLNIEERNSSALLNVDMSMRCDRNEQDSRVARACLITHVCSCAARCCVRWPLSHTHLRRLTPASGGLGHSRSRVVSVVVLAISLSLPARRSLLSLSPCLSLSLSLSSQRSRTCARPRVMHHQISSIDAGAATCSSKSAARSAGGAAACSVAALRLLRSMASE